MEDYEEKTLREHLVYDGKILRLYSDEILLPNGKPAKREYVRHSGGVGVVAEYQGKLLFVRQYRYAYRESILEIPAGKLERGEDPAICGKRELSEETGFDCGRMTKIGTFYPSPGYTDEKIYLYLAEDLRPGQVHPDDGEFLNVIQLSLEQVREMLESGAIRDMKTVLGLQYYFYRR